MKNNNASRTRKVENFRLQVQRSIRLIRQELGLSQEELARKLGINQATISNYESGKTEMTISQMFEFYLVCGKDLSISNIKNILSDDSKDLTPENKDSGE
ncbi:XRE family transcriptional regulator [Pseudoalteromonas rubra]|uniref:XRE family transcriptional regulator n=1 Tax=Pseudoalteromonas rubra TaxID=43658 RepID=A0A4Q7E9K8_9GAMM|nr:helix-turn-helix transcriptional regulator [Pseudoalteromonas rubra]RZM79910.1 XRE family transcriptional regulator [Pseudoalteromonas rubra]